MFALETTDLRKTYDNGVEALKGISLQVEQGDFFALLGPNGAGKSTLIGILSSLVNASSGQVNILGHDLSHDRNKAKALIGLVPQELNFNQFEKPIEIVVNQAGYYGVPRKIAFQRAEQYLSELDLWHKHNQPSRGLSGGMKRRLMIARAMMHEPKLLILDEPTAGVDIEIRRSMWKFLQAINAAGTTVILTTHYLEEAEQLCRNVGIINHGKIVENTTIRELLTRLDVETFILDLAVPVQTAPDIPGITVRLNDKQSLEVDVPKATAINQVFQALEQMNIQVLSMRNKANRLEELFVRMVESQRSEAAA